jgi:hypothetical protein
MCIINEPAEVHNTKIFVAPNNNHTQQLTVYSNEVRTSSTNNMMLLPVPYPDTINLVDFSDYISIFNDLNLTFKMESFGTSYSLPEKNYLKIVDIGNYKATIIPTHEDLLRINPSVFGTVNEHIRNILFFHYQNLPIPFGYIICKLKSGTQIKYHPFAYTHNLPKNHLNTPSLFVPTRHEHGHGNSDHADWDHCIFSLNTTPNSGNREIEDYHNYLKTKKINFNFGNINNIRKKTIKGHFPNNDILFEVNNTSTKPPLKIFTPYTP